ncbi:MAG: carboxypeptidase-like regulatory domain-containing protein [Pseudomonadota bacterium]
MFIDAKLKFLVVATLFYAGAVCGYDLPNHYNLLGPQVQIDYTVPKAVNMPVLILRQHHKVSQFAADQIQTTDTLMGQWVTITIAQIVDLQTETLSFLLPKIQLDNDTAYFRSELIYTIHKTTIAGPDLVRGPVQIYRPAPLFGRATYVPPTGDILGTLEGNVTLIHTCPGPELPGQNCTAPYVDAAVQVLNARGEAVAKATTDKNGYFNTQVASGSYTVHVATTAVLPRCGDEPVTILPDIVVQVKVYCDLGLR